jgi:hypothetical protein
MVFVALGDLGNVAVDIPVVLEHLLFNQFLEGLGHVHLPPHAAEDGKVFNSLFNIGGIVLETE